MANRTLRNICFLISFCLVVVSGDGIPSTQQLLDDYVTKSGPSQSFTGAQFSYMIPGTEEIRTFNSGTEGVGSKQKIAGTNLFGWGSITKEFITSLLMIKQAEGEFDPESTLGTYLPEYFPEWPEAWKDIKMYQIMNMTSGIIDCSYAADILIALKVIDMPLSKVLQQPYTPAQVVGLAASVTQSYSEACQQIKFCFKPGTSYHYSNTNYFIAGMVASKLFGGASLTELLEENVFSLLDKDETAYFGDSVLPKSILARMPQAYSRIINSDVLNVTNYPWNFMGAAGGLIGSTNSLIPLLRSLFKQGISGGKVATEWGYYVNRQTAELVTNFKEECTLGCYGLGVLKQYSPSAGTIYSYTGEPLGYRTVYVYYACQDYWAALSINSADTVTTGANVTEVVEIIASSIVYANPIEFPNVGGPEDCPSSQKKKSNVESEVRLDFLQQVQDFRLFN